MMSKLAKCPKKYESGEVERSQKTKARVHKYANDAMQFGWPGISKIMNVGPFTRWVYTGFSIASADPKASPSEAKRLFKEIKDRQDEGLLVGEEGAVGKELYHGAKRAAVMFGYTDCQDIKGENPELQWKRAKGIEQLAEDAGLTVLTPEDIDVIRDNVEPKGTEQAVIDAYDRIARDRPSELSDGQGKASQTIDSEISDGERWRRAPLRNAGIGLHVRGSLLAKAPSARHSTAIAILTPQTSASEIS